VTDCTEKTFNFPSFKRRKIDAQFSGGDITSDGGVLLLREIDRQLNLSTELSAVIPDPRNPLLITHTQESLLKQRIYGLALGYEDLNDHDKLRTDPAFQTAIEKDKVLYFLKYSMRLKVGIPCAVLL
jgi:Transposase DDE domain group 1